MQHIFDGYNHILRLDKGERLKESLDKFMAAAKVNGAWVSIIGAVSEVTLGFYDLGTKEYHWQTFPGLREITGIQGNLAADPAGTMVFHLHGSFSDASFQVIGGHIQNMTAAGTIEVFVHNTYKPLHRKADSDVGLQVLDV